MAYHLNNQNFHPILTPKTWSPAYENVCDLFILLISNAIDKRVTISEPSPVIDSREKLDFFQTILLQMISKSCSTHSREVLQKLTELKSISSISYTLDQSIWIIKPIGLSCGKDIKVAKGVLNTINYAKEFDYKCIVQKYIEKPLLVRNSRKFDIRQWVLISSLDPLIVYGFSECYLRLSSKEYSISNDNALADPLVHLCNHAIQKLNINDCNDENEFFLCDTMMTQKEFEKELTAFSTSETSNPFKDIIFSQIKDIVINTIQCIKPKLQNFGHGFEWLGYDLMIDEALRVNLIEVNTSPDISPSTIVTKRLVEAASKDTIDLLLFEYKNRQCLLEKETIPRFRGYSNDRSLTNECDSSQAPQWNLWYLDESFYTSLSDSNQSNSKFYSKESFRLNCICPDIDIANKIIEESLPKIKDEDLDEF